MAAAVKVKVRDGYAVFDGKTQRSGGDQLDVDAATADAWCAAGWVEPVKAPAKTTTAKRRKRT